jgi:hypothetical protein
LGLIASSTLIVLILESSSVVNPVLPFLGTPPKGTPGPTGTLAIRLISNQNQSEKFVNPNPRPPPAVRPFPIVAKSMVVSPADNSSSSLSEVIFTDSQGLATKLLSPGQYVVNLKEKTLDVNIPVAITAGNQTTVVVDVLGTAYPVSYSEDSGFGPSGIGVQSSMYAQLRTSASVAEVNERVILEFHGTAPGSGHLVNATVMMSRPPSQGTQWLDLGAAGTLDPANSTSIFMTTWSYSTFTSVQTPGMFVPIGV